MGRVWLVARPDRQAQVLDSRAYWTLVQRASRSLERRLSMVRGRTRALSLCTRSIKSKLIAAMCAPSTSALVARGSFVRIYLPSWKGTLLTVLQLLNAFGKDALVMCVPFVSESGCEQGE